MAIEESIAGYNPANKTFPKLQGSKAGQRLGALADSYRVSDEKKANLRNAYKKLVELTEAKAAALKAYGNGRKGGDNTGTPSSTPSESSSDEPNATSARNQPMDLVSESGDPEMEDEDSEGDVMMTHPERKQRRKKKRREVEYPAQEVPIERDEGDGKEGDNNPYMQGTGRGRRNSGSPRGGRSRTTSPRSTHSSPRRAYNRRNGYRPWGRDRGDVDRETERREEEQRESGRSVRGSHRSRSRSRSRGSRRSNGWFNGAAGVFERMAEAQLKQLANEALKAWEGVFTGAYGEDVAKFIRSFDSFRKLNSNLTEKEFYFCLMQRLKGKARREFRETREAMPSSDDDLAYSVSWVLQWLANHFGYRSDFVFQHKKWLEMEQRPFQRPMEWFSAVMTKMEKLKKEYRRAIRYGVGTPEFEQPTAQMVWKIIMKGTQVATMEVLKKYMPHRMLHNPRTDFIKVLERAMMEADSYMYPDWRNQGHLFSYTKKYGDKDYGVPERFRENLKKYGSGRDHPNGGRSDNRGFGGRARGRGRGRGRGASSFRGSYGMRHTSHRGRGRARGRGGRGRGHFRGRDSFRGRHNPRTFHTGRDGSYPGRGGSSSFGRGRGSIGGRSQPPARGGFHGSSRGGHRGSSSRGGRGGARGGWTSDGRPICRGCGKPGHIKRNCPRKGSFRAEATRLPRDDKKDRDGAPPSMVRAGPRNETSQKMTRKERSFLAEVLRGVPQAEVNSNHNHP